MAPGPTGTRGALARRSGLRPYTATNSPWAPKARHFGPRFPHLCSGGRGDWATSDQAQQAGKRPRPRAALPPSLRGPQAPGRHPWRRPRTDTRVSQAQCASWSWRSEHPEGLPGGGDACPRPQSPGRGGSLHGERALCSVGRRQLCPGAGLALGPLGPQPPAVRAEEGSAPSPCPPGLPPASDGRACHTEPQPGSSLPLSV